MTSARRAGGVGARGGETGRIGSRRTHLSDPRPGCRRAPHAPPGASSRTPQRHFGETRFVSAQVDGNGRDANPGLTYERRARRGFALTPGASRFLNAAHAPSPSMRERARWNDAGVVSRVLSGAPRNRAEKLTHQSTHVKFSNCRRRRDVFRKDLVTGRTFRLFVDPEKERAAIARAPHQHHRSPWALTSRP